jgi:hypothetical protein
MFSLHIDYLGYSLSSMFHGFYYGWMCFLGETPSLTNRDDDTTIYVNCNASIYVILLYVLSTFGVLVSLHSILETGSIYVPRLLCIAICTAFVLLWIYDIYNTSYQVSPYIFGGSVGAADILAMVLLVLGMEIYGRDPEPDVELITNYSPDSQRYQHTYIPDSPAIPTSSNNNSNNSNFMALAKDTNKAVFNH